MADNGLSGYLAGENDGPGGVTVERVWVKVCGRLFCSEECADSSQDGRP